MTAFEFRTGHRPARHRTLGREYLGIELDAEYHRKPKAGRISIE